MVKVLKFLPLAFLGAFIVFSLFIMGAAHAQESVGFAAAITESIRTWIEAAVFAAITAFLAWATTWLREKWGLEVEEKHRQALQSALENAAKLVLDSAMGKIEGKKKVEEITVDANDMSKGIDYVKKSVSDAIEQFGLDDLRIKELLKPKVLIPTVLKKAIDIIL